MNNHMSDSDINLLDFSLKHAMNFARFFRHSRGYQEIYSEIKQEIT